MAYGTGQPLMAGFDPSTLRQDFSGFVNAAAIRGQTMANLGEDISGVLKMIGEKNKEQQNQEKEILKNAKLASLIAERTSDPQMRQSLIELSSGLQDKERPLSERIAEAEAIPALIQYQTNAMRAAGFGNVSGVVDVPVGGGTMQKMFYNKQGRLTPVVGGGGGGGAVAADGSIREPDITEAEFQQAGVPMPPGGDASGALLPPLQQQGQPVTAPPAPRLADDIEIMADQEIGPPPDDAVSMAIEQLAPGQSLSPERKSALEKENQTRLAEWERKRDSVERARAEVYNSRIKIAADIEMLSRLDPNFNADQALTSAEQKIQDSLVKGGVSNASLVARGISAQLGSQVSAAESAPTREKQRVEIEKVQADIAKTEAGAIMTPQQLQELQGQNMTFKAVPIQGGNYKVTSVSPLPPSQQARLSVSRDGTVEFTSGTEAQTKEERAAVARKRMEQTSLTLVSDSARNAIPLMEKGLRSGTFMPTIQAAIGKTLGGTEVGQIESELSTIRGTISFNTMKELRAISPSGGGAGTMTEAEWPRFERRIGNLEIGQDPKILMRNLKNVPIVLFEAANGTPEEVEQNFKQKKITAEVYNNYVNEFLELRESLGVGLSGVEGKSETKFTPKFATPDGKLVPYGQQPIPSVSPGAQDILKKYRD